MSSFNISISIFTLNIRWLHVEIVNWERPWFFPLKSNFLFLSSFFPYNIFWTKTAESLYAYQINCDFCHPYYCRMLVKIEVIATTCERDLLWLFLPLLLPFPLFLIHNHRSFVWNSFFLLSNECTSELLNSARDCYMHSKYLAVKFSSFYYFRSLLPHTHRMQTECKREYKRRKVTIIIKKNIGSFFNNFSIFSFPFHQIFTKRMSKCIICHSWYCDEFTLTFCRNKIYRRNMKQ